jgi:hypothetical protein
VWRNFGGHAVDGALPPGAGCSSVGRASDALAWTVEIRQPLCGLLRALGLLLILGLLLPNAAAAQVCARADFAYVRGRELFEAGQHLLAAIHFSQSSLAACSSQQRDQALLAYALSMFRLGESDQMLFITRPLMERGVPEVARRARLLLGFALSNPALVASEDDRERLALWQERSEPEQFAQRITDSFSLAGRREALRALHRQMGTLPTRSPVLAGVLSGLIPGLGQAYAGAWQSAGVALVLNALALGTTLELFSRGLLATGVAVGLVFSVTYVGNIINAAQTATLFNRAHRREMEAELERQLFPDLHP